MSISVPEAVQEIAKGNMLILCDHPHRENEGDFIIAAEKATVDALNTMIQLGRGLVCCPLTIKTAERLALPPQSETNTALHGTQFTVSVDAKACAGSGISAHDRVLTIHTLANRNACAEDFVRPGHVFPIVGHRGGVRYRPGHTEATLALLELAGKELVGVVCEIINDNGSMANAEELQRLSRQLGIGIITIEEIIQYIKE